MKRLYIATCFLLALGGCEDRILPELQEAPAVIVIDAFLNNLDSTQSIRITQTSPYFDNSGLVGIEGATVAVSSSSGNAWNFLDQGSGYYIWQPVAPDNLGQIGETYTLKVDIGADHFEAVSVMNRIPVIDSISFRFEKENLFLPDSYFAEFWARDLPGTGDTYWIKSFKNGVYLNQPNEINIAFDAGFSQGGNVDGLIFIPPIRDAINPFVQDENDKFLSPFEDTDSIYVEIHSISNKAFKFLNDLRIQTDRPGGFAELFATPLANLNSNIQYTGDNPPVPVVGFFNVAAVTGAGKRLDISKVPKPN